MPSPLQGQDSPLSGLLIYPWASIMRIFSAFENGFKRKRERDAFFGSLCHGILTLSNWFNWTFWNISPSAGWNSTKQLHLPNIYVVKFWLSPSLCTTLLSWRVISEIKTFFWNHEKLWTSPNAPSHLFKCSHFPLINRANISFCEGVCAPFFFHYIGWG